MDEHEAAVAVKRLRAELVEAHNDLEAARRRMSGLSKLIEGYVELFPSLAPREAVLRQEPLPEPGRQRVTPADQPAPKGQEAVLAVMMEHPGKWYTVPAMTRELESRGWTPESPNP